MARSADLFGKNQLALLGAAKAIKFALIVDPDLVTANGQFVKANYLGQLSRTTFRSFGFSGFEWRCWRVFFAWIVRHKFRIDGAIRDN
jgi:hypothetical protein